MTTSRTQPATGYLARVTAAIEAELPAAVRLRQRIHADPRISGAEEVTRDLVVAAVTDDSPRGQVSAVADTGAIVHLPIPGASGSPVAVRAELDALEVTETTGVGWASTRPGVMHACGHDVHLAALTCLLRALAVTGGPAPVTAILQPREETAPSGARDVLLSGSLPTGCAAVIAAHVQPQLSAGVTACTPGTVNASSDEFSVTVTGQGGHAAYPHTTKDPIAALAHIVTAVQSLRSRHIDPTATAVVAVTRLEGGTTTNVIPDRATAYGTIRADSAADRATLAKELTQLCVAMAGAYGCATQVTITEGEPPLHNDPALANRTARQLESLGSTVVRDMRSAGSDDFAFYSGQMPSLMMFVGVDNGSACRNPEDSRLHSGGFLPTDRAVRDVTYALLAGYLAAAAGRTRHDASVTSWGNGQGGAA
ncbi:M20 family metallopeptidase [Streptomyces sp. NPDC001508]|uniref:M20 metallopeptidase family protein n=1 Tax=Streptomyces sp. NPDC001508 TaxID=3154656 RepID=UPI0033225941